MDERGEFITRMAEITNFSIANIAHHVDAEILQGGKVILREWWFESGELCSKKEHISLETFLSLLRGEENNWEIYPRQTLTLSPQNAERMGKITQLCKTAGYKMSQEISAHQWLWIYPTWEIPWRA